MKKILFTLIVLASATVASAQIQSTYFLDNYSYSYRHNPANIADKSFFGLGISNIEAGVGSSLGLSSLLYPAQSGDGLVTGFHSSVSSEEFLKGIEDSNAFLGGLNLNILSLGIRGEKSMTTFEINSRTLLGASVDGDLFRLLKQGSQNAPYDFSSTNADVKSYVELAFGYSRRLGENFSFGLRVKGLMGVAGAYANLQDSKATLSDSQIAVNLKGEAGIAGSLLSFQTDSDGKISGVEMGSGFSPAGFGAAIDAGVNWKPTENLTVSAAVADLGIINWKYSSMAEGNNSVTYDGVDISGENSDINDEIDKVKDDFTDLANFRKKSGEESSSEMLPFRVNASVRYQIPNVKCLSAGALVTYQNSVIPVLDIRAAVTFTPVKWFSLTGNAGSSSFGPVCGGALSLGRSAVNFFLGVDAYLGPISSDLIPVNSFNCKLNLGLVLRFGKN